jgi:hypothetical protein
MFAARMTVTIGPAQLDQVQKSLRGEIVPMVEPSDEFRPVATSASAP